MVVAGVITSLVTTRRGVGVSGAGVRSIRSSVFRGGGSYFCEHKEDTMPDLKKQLELQVKRLKAVQVPAVEAPEELSSPEAEKARKTSAGEGAAAPPRA